MANHYEGNVIFVDTGASFSYARNIKAIKYIGNTNGTATITKVGSSNKLWEQDGANDVLDEVCIRAPQGVTVALTNGAAVYIYLK